MNENNNYGRPRAEKERKSRNVVYYVQLILYSILVYTIGTIYKYLYFILL